MRVLGGASLLDARLDGKDAIGSPKSQFNLGFDFDVPGVDGLAFDVRGVHTAKQFADTANTQAVPSWNRFDIGGRYVVDVQSHEVTLRAGVTNVANRSYWAAREALKLDVFVVPKRLQIYHEQDGYFGLTGDENLFLRTRSGGRITLVG